ncbi:MAG: DUF2493 domain-containing protein [Hyphomicrobiales bacterium]|nr:DUF2493 domain-containing protein [Hyphomicrobiales bacterium]MDE2116168.1 DUF2493 domain-containing protein [Hyphomicrobiales bacterium]
MSSHLDDAGTSSSTSPTQAFIDNQQLYGYRPFQDEPDPRPLPEERTIDIACADMIDALAATLVNTRLEPDLPELLWSAVNLFHSAAQRIERELDDNGAMQLRAHQEQDGSEIRSVELERLTAEGMTMIERRDTMEYFRDAAANQYSNHTGQPWLPRSRSQVSHKALTSALIDSRDFLAARARAKTTVLLPAGPKIALTGGLDFEDHKAIWARLDQSRIKHPDMVLMHGGSPKGAEHIASLWAKSRKVPQIAFKPDWAKHAKSAPFKRNDAMLEVLPLGVLIYPGTGIQENLADKARKMGIPVWRFARKEG